jgi:hypothetical protein
MRHRVKTFIVFLESLSYLLTVSFLLHTLKIRRVRSLFGKLTLVPKAMRVDGSELLLSYMVRRAARFVPGSTCLVQAISLSRMLASRGVSTTIRIGVVQSAGGFLAHAWLDGPSGTIIGGEELRDQGFRHISDLDLTAA